GRNVITYCQSGVRSAHTWLVLREVLGIENVWNYEGSWIEWSYAASEYSDYPSQRILELTELWNDNRGAI
ncbi:MAG: rhodanese-like domain-containing protein, partial [Oscillospiraceae bacterium]|nr:rhodanese-like domain-containing protein [Oscillospiraceae bacterium]